MAAKSKPNPPQPAAAGHSPVIGERVLAGPAKLRGIVRYIGPTDFAQGEWVGIVLDEPLGKNNGSVQGKKYFECEDAHGIFIRQTQVAKCDEGEPRGSQASLATTAGQSAGTSEKGLAPEKAGESADLIKKGKRPSEASQGRAAGALSAVDRNTVRQQLAEAAEEHDVERLAQLLPLAEKCGVSAADLENAQRVMNFKSQHSLLQEVDRVRTAVARLAQTVQEVEARAAAVEQAVAARAIAAGAGVQAAAGPDGLSPQMQTWLQEIGQQLQEQVWTALEVHMEEVVSRAVAQATRELTAAASDVRGLRGQGLPHDPVRARQDAAATRIQARARGNAERTLLENQRKAAVRLQAAVRGWLERRRHGGRFKNAADIVHSRHKGWMQLWDAAARRGRNADGLERRTFEEAVREAHPRVSYCQTDVLWMGITTGMGKAGIPRLAFCKLCEAIAMGDREAAEFADIAPERFASLGPGVEGRQPKPASEDERHAAAVKIQSRYRGVRDRRHIELQHAMASRLQRGAREWLARKQGHSGTNLVATAAKVQNRHKDWVTVFEQTAQGEKELALDTFTVALSQVHPRVSKAQAAALFTGYTCGMGVDGVDTPAFCKVAEAVAQGDRVASEYADLAPEKFTALGSEGGHAGQPRQSAHAGDGHLEQAKKSSH